MADPASNEQEKHEPVQASAGEAQVIAQESETVVAEKSAKKNKGKSRGAYRKPPKSGMWKPGQTGNPKGRPRKLKRFDDLLAEIPRSTDGKAVVRPDGEPADHWDLILRQAIAIALDRRDARCADMVKFLITQKLGKPKERVELTGEDGGPIMVDPISAVVQRMMATREQQAIEADVITPLPHLKAVTG